MFRTAQREAKTYLQTQSTHVLLSYGQVCECSCSCTHAHTRAHGRWSIGGPSGAGTLSGPWTRSTRGHCSRLRRIRCAAGLVTRRDELTLLPRSRRSRRRVDAVVRTAHNRRPLSDAYRRYLCCVARTKENNLSSQLSFLRCFRSFADC